MSHVTRSPQPSDAEDDTAPDEGKRPDDDAGKQESDDETALPAPRDSAEQDPATRPARRNWRAWRTTYPRAARTANVTATVLSALLVVFALLVPNSFDRLLPISFTRIPAEGVLLAGMLLVLPPRARRVMTVVTGVFLGLLTILKLTDMGFFQVLGRPFNLVFDWILFDDATDFLKDSVGPTGAALVVIVVVVLVIAVLTLMTLAVVRLTNLMVRHRQTSARTTLILGTAWIMCMTLNINIAGLPVAAKFDAELVRSRVNMVRDGIRDGQVFAKEAADDDFAGVPPDQLLTGLRGKDVLFTFIESYGRSAIDDPAMAEQIDAVLTEGNTGLEAAGFSSRSGWLTAPIAGAGSWLAHSTFLSGLWIKNQQRYRTLTASDRMTLTSAFGRTGAWRTVGIVPGVRKAWPEGKFFGLDNIYDSEHLGYQGPYFSWSPVPDQFSLEAFERLERGKKDREPIMAEIILASSHNPWAPIPRMVGWDELGDGSVFEQIKKEGKDPTDVWKDSDSVRTEYRRAIEYSLTSLTQYIERYGDENTVVVFLGDHQPNPTVTGSNAGLDVPITVVAKDQKVLDRIADWGWTEGLKPADDAPKWRMDQFRDRFMTAYGPEK
ncbi:sulfatase [Streptomyces sp. ADMS]|uniref:sulfatase n=1 Tax=Streptomyces sp. ADMS TaxID=3071415 RepID=UPI00296F5BD4|nr:sulfatase [Streptomyces sp. ADMS]MDW4904047.1 sulfatase [Streptomyces sp. ADMS]